MQNGHTVFLDTSSKPRVQRIICYRIHVSDPVINPRARSLPTQNDLSIKQRITQNQTQRQQGKMRGLKLLATTALAANRGTVHRPDAGVKSIDQQPNADVPTFGRRKALQQILSVGAAASIAPTAAFGLDMDAFMNSELENDKKNCDPKRDPKCVPKLTSDEALCKYGQSGNARSEACKRVKATGGALPEAKKEKSLGGAYAM